MYLCYYSQTCLEDHFYVKARTIDLYNFFLIEHVYKNHLHTVYLHWVAIIYRLYFFGSILFISLYGSLQMAGYTSCVKTKQLFLHGLRVDILFVMLSILTNIWDLVSNTFILFRVCRTLVITMNFVACLLVWSQTISWGNLLKLITTRRLSNLLQNSQLLVLGWVFIWMLWICILTSISVWSTVLKYVVPWIVFWNWNV